MVKKHFLNIKYDLMLRKFDVDSSLNLEGQVGVIENFLRDQRSESEDKSKIIKRDIYSVNLTWYP